MAIRYGLRYMMYVLDIAFESGGLNPVNNPIFSLSLMLFSLSNTLIFLMDFGFKAWLRCYGLGLAFLCLTISAKRLMPEV
jgi:hypothetical protein